MASNVHDRFPTYESLVVANLLLPHEKAWLETADKRTPHETTYIPILWALNLIQNARKDDKIKIDAPVYANLISAFDLLEGQNRRLLNHGWINFPLAYTQVKIVPTNLTQLQVVCTYLPKYSHSIFKQT